MRIHQFLTNKILIPSVVILCLCLNLTLHAQNGFNLVYENKLDGRSGTAEKHGLTVFEGGFGDAPTGLYSFGDLRIFIRRQYTPEPLRDLGYTNGELLGVNVNRDQVLTFQGNQVEVNHPVLFRLVVAAEPNATVTIGLYDPEHPTLTAFSTWEHIRELGRNSLFSDWKVLYVLFTPKSNKVIPVIQVASSDPSNRSAAVLIDNLKIYEVPKNGGDFRVLLEHESESQEN